MKHRKCWSKSIGERGARVRLYEDRPGGPLNRSVYIKGKEKRKSLGHRDKELAIRQAYELLHSLLSNQQAFDRETLTIGMAAQLYLESPQHLSKKPLTQRCDKRELERVVAFLGASRDVASLSESDVRRFTMARRQGDPKLKYVVPGKPVRDRTIEMDLGTLHWRAEHDKKGYEQVVVMSESVQDVLAAQRKAQAAIGKTAVFPAPKDATKPCNRHLFDDWLRRAYKLAKIVPQRRGMWHSIRRKWATERKGYPVKDVAAAGGWKTEEVLVTSYQQADAETIKNVVLHPTHRIVSR